MRQNRKKTETYRFNGNPYFRPSSIHSVEMVDLERLITQFEAKLADAEDADDKKWTARWLGRFRKELAKKQAGFRLKQRERQSRRAAVGVGPVSD